MHLGYGRLSTQAMGSRAMLLGDGSGHAMGSSGDRGSEAQAQAVDARRNAMEAGDGMHGKVGDGGMGRGIGRKMYVTTPLP